jgi:hypothetical protein
MIRQLKHYMACSNAQQLLDVLAEMDHYGIKIRTENRINTM